MQVKILDQTHADYDGEHLAKLRALHEGGRAWRRLIETWVPKYARESSDVWRDRKRHASYVNHAGPVVSMLSALLFSEPASIADADADYYTRLQADADKRGTGWSEFWRQVLDDAQVGRVAAVWVNFPARPEDEPVESLADEDRMGLRDAFLVPLAPEQIRNWGVDERGLAWVMIKGAYTRQAGPTDAAQQVTRWTAITRETVTVWEWVRTEDQIAPGPDDEVSEVRTVQHGCRDEQGRQALPLVMVELPPGLWTMGKLADPATVLTRAENDLDWALHQAANELLVIKSQAQGELVTGHGAYLQVGPEDDAKFVGPSGVAFEHLGERVGSAREDLYRVVHQMALAADRGAAEAARSGESKQMDWQAMEIILASFQGLVLTAMTRCLRLIASTRQDTAIAGRIRATGLEGWQTEDLGTWLEQTILAVDAPRLSPTYRRAVAQHQAKRLLEGKVPEEQLAEILREIEEADVEPDVMGVTPPPRNRSTDDGGDPGE